MRIFLGFGPDAVLGRAPGADASWPGDPGTLNTGIGDRWLRGRRALRAPDGARTPRTKAPAAMTKEGSGGDRSGSRFERSNPACMPTDL